jgi:hypothetical protein
MDTLITITIRVHDEHADPADSTGITHAAFRRLYGLDDPVSGPLDWFGSIESVEILDEDALGDFAIIVAAKAADGNPVL